MKMKLVMATALATVTAIGSFIESAEAQRSRRGNTYSSTGSDEQSVLAQFSLVNATEDGQPIVDQEGANDYVGLFMGAIENYTGGFGEVCVGQAEVCDAGSPSPDDPRYIVDSAGFPIFVQPFVPNSSPFDGDLRAEFFAANEDPLFDQIFDQNPNDFSDAAIAYSILKPGEAEPVISYRLDIAGLDQDQAVNSITYIIENNLLGEAQPVVTEFGPPFLDIGDNLVQAVIPVPEPSSAPGTFLVALVGAGLLLKRKMKRS